MAKFALLLISCFFCCTCWGQTQVELNQSAQERYLAADRELNQVYQQILKTYRQDTGMIQNFKKAQRLWIQFRDAEMLVRYPAREPGYYGSIQPMCWSEALTELTLERTQKLKQWLQGAPEGDACSGSLQNASDLPSPPSDPAQVGLQFINAYIKFCNQPQANSGLLQWAQAQPQASPEFQKALAEFLRNPKNQPLDFDPILNAQDYPDQGFQFHSYDSTQHILTVQGIQWPDFHLQLQMISRNGIWQVGGCGAIPLHKSKKHP